MDIWPYGNQRDLSWVDTQGVRWLIFPCTSKKKISCKDSFPIFEIINYGKRSLPNAIINGFIKDWEGVA